MPTPTAPRAGAPQDGFPLDRPSGGPRGDHLAGDGAVRGRPPSLPAQRQALRHCVEIARRATGPEVIATAEAGLATLAWLERRAELARALAELDRTAPGLAALLEAFPGSAIDVIRETPR